MNLTQTIRPVEDRDWDAIAPIVNAYDDDGYTGDIMRARTSRWQEGDPRLLLVAETAGEIVAYGTSLRRASDPAGKFSFYVYVAPLSLGQGLGRELLARAEAFALDNGGTFLISHVLESCKRGQGFAERAGYRPIQRLFESTLDLDAFDASPFGDLRSSLEAKGYRFATLAELGDTEENRRKLHLLDVNTDKDTPGFENWGIRSFEQYSRDEYDSFGFSADGVFVALYDDRFVGMHALRKKPIDGLAHVDYTGVVREHRGNRLGLALKVIGAGYAKSLGASKLSTNNDDRNVPMLRINEQMGYVAEPGFFLYRKDFDKERSI